MGLNLSNPLFSSSEVQNVATVDASGNINMGVKLNQTQTQYILNPGAFNSATTLRTPAAGKTIYIYAVSFIHTQPIVCDGTATILLEYPSGTVIAGYHHCNKPGSTSQTDLQTVYMTFPIPLVCIGDGANILRVNPNPAGVGNGYYVVVYCWEENTVTG